MLSPCPSSPLALKSLSVGPHIFSVTGTNGKTTTAYLVDAGLRAAGRVTGPHLHWSLRWKESRLDAELLTPPMAIAMKNSGMVAPTHP